MKTIQPVCECGSACQASADGPLHGHAPHPCALAADSLLDQAGAFIAALPSDAYARACDTASGGTIGKHLRHLLDHFAAVLAAVREAHSVIDYDHRDRDVPMETSTSAALSAIEAVRTSLTLLPAHALEQAVVVRVMLDATGHTADLRSTVGRELAFATHHALHHHAMMKFIADTLGIATPEGFGRAPSTLNHERRRSATLSPWPASGS